MNPVQYHIGTSWKMNKTVREATAYCQSLVRQLDALAGRTRVQVFLVPPFTALAAVKAHMQGRCLVGAQNMHWEDSGAFTGEISAPMLAELGVDLVELGHSERRALFNETDALVNRKVRNALKHGLRPLVCVGETAEEKRRGGSGEAIGRQVRIALSGVDAAAAEQIWIAYEPVWAIGDAGVPAEPDYIHERIGDIRTALRDMLGAPGGRMPILYGGSVDRDNAAPILHRGGCDGLFIGRAAWEAEGLVEIIRRCLALDPVAARSTLSP